MRTSSAAAIILVITALVTGCSKAPTQSKNEIRWSADNNPDRQHQIALFEKTNPGLKVKLDFTAVGLQKVLVQIAGGCPPDVLMVYSTGDFQALAQKGALEDLTPYVKKYGLDMSDFWPSIKNSIYYDGKIYGLPEASSPLVLYYNKKLFDEAGIEYPKGTWTWQDVLKIAPKLTKYDPRTGRVVQSGFLIYETSTLNALIYQNGGSFFTKDGAKCVANSQACVDALQFWYDIVFKHKFGPKPSDMQSMGQMGGWAGGADLMANGKIAMMTGARYPTINLRKYKDADWDIAALPKGKYKININASHTNCVAKLSKNKEAAFKFLMSLVSKEGELLVSDYGDCVPSRRSIASSPEFLYNPKYPREKNNKVYLEETKIAVPLGEVSPFVSPIEVDRVLNQLLEKMWAGQKSPRQVLDEFAAEMNRQIAAARH